MDTNKAKKLLISYWPLLQFDEFLKKPGDTIEGIDDISKRLREIDVPQIAGVMWGGYPFDAEDLNIAHAIPILLMDRAAEVANHLIDWLEGDTDRFTLHFEQRDTGYAVLLVPNVQKSIDRWKSARLMYHEEIVTDNDFIIYFQTLGVCCLGGTTFKEIKTKIASPCYLGFLDLKDIDSDDPKTIKYEKITIAGPFKIGVDVDHVKPHMDNLFEHAIEPVQSKLNE